MQRTIKTAQILGGPFTFADRQDPSKQVTMYNCWVTCEDGFAGLACTKSDTPPYGPGDVMEITETGKFTKKNKPKIKVKKVDNWSGGGGGNSGGSSGGSQRPSGGSSGGGDRELGMQVGNAMTNAVAMLIAGVGSGDLLGNAKMIIDAGNAARLYALDPKVQEKAAANNELIGDTPPAGGLVDDEEADLPF